MHCMEASDDDSEQEEIVQTVHQLEKRKMKGDPIWVQVTINKKPFTMELDTVVHVGVEWGEVPQSMARNGQCDCPNNAALHNVPITSKTTSRSPIAPLGVARYAVVPYSSGFRRTIYRMFLIAIDAHSKWLEVLLMTRITAVETIEKLRQLIATHGLLETIVTDNGAAFISTEFQEYTGVVLINTAPYHPTSNSLAK